MIGNIIGIAIGVGAIALGAKGFSQSGLPLTKEKNITGGAAKAIGVVCFLIGAAFIGLCLMGLLAGV